MRLLRKCFQSLRIKLILIICMILLPMNVMLLVLSQYLIYNVERELTLSYENELAIYMTRVDDGLLDIERQIKAFMGENWTDLTPGSDNYELARYQIWLQLKSARENLELVDAAYLKTNWDDWTVLTYKGEHITFEEAETIKAYFTAEGMEAYQPYIFEVIDIAGEKYVIENMNYYDYSFGMVIKVSTILSGLMKVQNDPEEKICLADLEGTIVSRDGAGAVQMGRNIQELTIDGSKEEYMVISGPSEKMDYCIVRMVPTYKLSEAIPIMERGIQAVCILCIILIPLMYCAIRRLVLKPLNGLNDGMHEIEQENLSYRMAEEHSSSEFRHMNHVFNNMAEQIQSLRIEAYERDIEKLRIETVNLRLQINPHLLLNSLNMIYSLAQSKNYECIKEYTLNLVEYFRYSLRQNDELVTVHSEMKFVKNFLEIQKIRFPNAFISVYDIEEDLYDVLLPPLLVQNFVENSIKYALKLGEMIEIIIIMKSDGQKIVISVIDTGNGIRQETLIKLRLGEPVEDRIGKYIGIWNCRRRLKVFYGEEAEMTISSEEGAGTQVWMEFPIQRMTGEKHETINCR